MDISKKPCNHKEYIQWKLPIKYRWYLFKYFLDLLNDIILKSLKNYKLLRILEMRIFKKPSKLKKTFSKSVLKKLLY